MVRCHSLEVVEESVLVVKATKRNDRAALATGVNQDDYLASARDRLFWNESFVKKLDRHFEFDIKQGQEIAVS